MAVLAGDDVAAVSHDYRILGATVTISFGALYFIGQFTGSRNYFK